MEYYNGIYEGEWKNGKREGFGIYKYNNNEKYMGTWKNDLEDGDGRYIYKNGDIFDGKYRYGKKEGRGLYTYNNDNEKDKIYCEWKYKENHCRGGLVYVKYFNSILCISGKYTKKVEVFKLDDFNINNFKDDGKYNGSKYHKEGGGNYHIKRNDIKLKTMSKDKMSSHSKLSKSLSKDKDKDTLKRSRAKKQTVLVGSRSRKNLDDSKNMSLSKDLSASRTSKKSKTRREVSKSHSKDKSKDDSKDAISRHSNKKSTHRH